MNDLIVTEIIISTKWINNLDLVLMLEFLIRVVNRKIY